VKPDQVSAFEDIEFADIPVFENSPNSAGAGATFRGVDIIYVGGSPPLYRCRCGERVLVTHSLESARDAITLDLDRSETDRRRWEERKTQHRRAISKSGL
jgi:hypothetical protein